MHKFFLLLVLTASTFALPLPADEQSAGSGGLSPESIQKSLSSALNKIKENPGLLDSLKDKLSKTSENKSSTPEVASSPQVTSTSEGNTTPQGSTTPEGVKAASDAHALLTETPSNGESKQSSSDSESSDKSSGNADAGAKDEKNTSDAKLLKPDTKATETSSSDKADKTDAELLKPDTKATETSSSEKADKTDAELLKPDTKATETKTATTNNSDSSTSAAVALTDLTPEDAQKAVQSTPEGATKEQIEKAADA